MFRAILLSIIFTTSLTSSFKASACDDKPCEKAYLVETKQHIANHVRRAETYKTERHAYSSNRERRAYALVKHLQLLIFGRSTLHRDS